MKKEWLRVIIWSALIVLLANIPYIYGYAIQTPDKLFMGDAQSSIDTNPYLAWMKQAADGHLLFKILYTTEPHSRIYFHPFFLILGNIARFTGMSPFTVHGMSRILLGFFLLLFTYFFISYFIKDESDRLITFLIVSFAGGFGWVNYFPAISKIPDAWFTLGWTEGSMLLLLYSWPLWIVSVLLLAAAFYFAVRALEENNGVKFAITAGILALFLILTHSYDVAIVYPILIVYVLTLFIINRDRLALKRHLSMISIIIGISSLAVIYTYLASHLDPVFFEHTWKQPGTLSPPFIWYVALFGFPFLLSLLGVIRIVLDPGDNLFKRKMFLVIWSAMVPFLMYLPVNFQRRLMEGANVPIAILASIGLIYLSQRLKWDKKIAAVIFIFLIIPGNFVVFQKDMGYLSRNMGQLSVAGFLDRNIHEGIKWLGNNTRREEVVLCDFEIGNYIPALSGNVVYIGHHPQTLKFFEKQQLLARFFAKSTADDWRRKFLKVNGINYLFYSWKEMKLGDFEPKNVTYLKEIYKNPSVIIYRVIF